MKYLLFLAIGISLASCVMEQYRHLEPDHIGVRTGVDFEIQEGREVKTKPSISACVDWNL